MSLAACCHSSSRRISHCSPFSTSLCIMIYDLNSIHTSYYPHMDDRFPPCFRCTPPFVPHSLYAELSLFVYICLSLFSPHSPLCIRRYIHMIRYIAFSFLFFLSLVLLGLVPFLADNASYACCILYHFPLSSSFGANVHSHMYHNHFSSLFCYS